MKSTPFIIADVFTNVKFGGNQLAVFTKPAGLDTATMQEIAREMNYSETTFLLPPEGEGDFKIRIFTPARELPFAGHPIVGSSFVIAAEGLKKLADGDSSIVLEAGVGPVPVVVAMKKGTPGRTTMTQPLPRVTVTASEPVVETLAASLGIESSDITDTGLPVQAIYNGITVVIVPVNSLETVRSLRPEYGKLESLVGELGAETVLVFSQETEQPESTVHCRVYAPGAGVAEDAATGSANGPLGYYLVLHKVVEASPAARIISEQGFEMKRPSILYIDVETSAETGAVSSVKVGGDVVISGRGEVLL